LLNANRSDVEQNIYLAMAYAQLGRPHEAAIEVARVISKKPDFSAETWIDKDIFWPGGSAAMLFFDGARKAGLPLCASVSDAARIDPKNRLPECDAERAKAMLSPT
jgi:hypothetical protein